MSVCSALEALSVAPALELSSHLVELIPVGRPPHLELVVVPACILQWKYTLLAVLRTLQLNQEDREMIKYAVIQRLA